MNELLQKHGCSAVFSIPEGLKELMSDITREVLRDQPRKIFDYIANYLSVLLITREHGIMAVKILDDLCDCRASVSEHLLQMGMEKSQAEMLAQVIKEEVEEFEPVEGKEKVKEMQILKKILTRTPLDEEMSAKVCQVARNAYRDYWYRKKMMQKSMKVSHDEPWEIAAQRTLELYKRTKPSFAELNRATEKIQAAYKGYHVRRNLLRHLKPKPKKSGPKVELPGAPLDVAGSREIDLGPVINIKVREDDIEGLFDEDVEKKLGLQYDPMHTITHLEGDSRSQSSRPASSSKSLTSHSQFKSVQSKLDMEAKPSMMIQGHPEDGGPRQSRLPSQMAPVTSEITSRQSRLPSQMGSVPSEMTSRQSRLPSQMGPVPSEMASRQSRLPSQLDPAPSEMTSRQSRLPSQMGPEPSEMTSRQSRLPSQMGPEPSEMTSRQSRLPSQMGPEPSEMTSRQSRLPSQIGPVKSEITSKQSQLPSQMAAVTSEISRKQSQQHNISNAPSLTRISFAATEPEVFEVDAVDADIVEELPPDALEVPADDDIIQEVPEEIPDDRTDGDGQSEPTVSAPSSAPITDVEDGGDATADEEEA